MQSELDYQTLGLQKPRIIATPSEQNVYSYRKTLTLFMSQAHKYPYK